MIGGTLVTIKADLAPWQAVPDPIAPQGDDPGHGDVFNGVLAGELSVSPTGAATYTVPIRVPPGVAGMAPNLSLVYNSQGGDGIAGQGWELGGLSMIHRCPKTLVQDGRARQVQLGAFQSVPEDDGVCLDGKRLFQQSSVPFCPAGATCFESESNDFSVIARYPVNPNFPTGDVFFTVVTKSGETRSYGSRPESRVFLPRQSPASAPGIAVWPINRVMDAWGNYFDVHYHTDFAAHGIRVSEIDYTGHVTGAALDENGQPGSPEDPVSPPYSVTFYYEDRPDVRNVRFGPGTLPKNTRLTEIATWYKNAHLGSYTLDYMVNGPIDDGLLLPSRLQQIKYCAMQLGQSEPEVAGCLEPLEFEWDGGDYRWDQQPFASGGQENSYELVSRLMWKLATAPLPDAWLGLCSTTRYAAASSSRETTSTSFS